MRTLILILILANLAFATWALLIDRPVSGPAARDISHLPRLVLASEPAPGARLATAVGGTAAKVSPGAAEPGGAAGATRCVTVGPFNDLVTVAAAAALLQSRGFTATQRDEPGLDETVYWVHLDNVPSEAAASRMLKKLHSSGLADARVMPAAAATAALQVSVGLFNEHDGAERRARQVKSLGLTPVITEQHQPQATYWVNINLASPDQTVSTQGLLPAPAAGAHLEISDCPLPPSSAPAPVPAPSAASGTA